jgi:hypothetical protein
MRNCLLSGPFFCIIEMEVAMDTIDKEKAQTNPSSVFDKPADVVATKELSPKEKTKVLQEWELDARLSDVATEEGMSKKKPAQPEGSVLRDVKKAQRKLGVEPIEDGGAPTKFTP